MSSSDTGTARPWPASDRPPTSTPSTNPSTVEPTGKVADVQLPRRRLVLATGGWRVLGVVSLGGSVGAVARYGLTVAIPVEPGNFPWATFLVNVTGCLLIGALMVLITELWTGRRLLRPFLGIGVLGGFTTFSAYDLEVQGLLSAGDARLALLYLGGTVVAALFAVRAAATVTRWAIGLRRESV